MEKAKRTINQNKTNLLVDSGIFAAFLIAMEPEATGLAIHEWLSIAFSAMILVHLLLHWKWLAQVTRRIFGRLAGQARINYVLNLLLFIDVTLIIFTGVMISEAVLPTLGIITQPDFFWRGLHSLAADLSMLLVGLHLALHWKWIANAVSRYMVKPAVRFFKQAPAAQLETQKETI